MAIETAGLTEGCKSKALENDRNYHYILFLGTSPSTRGQGLCSKLVKHYQTIASKEGVPIWLEAATEYRWRLYLKLVFVTVEELKLGVERAAETGRHCKGGEAVTLRG
ncbi:hypothetical protein DL95DRAFT_408546 [Leptodontidium sp. 2 PMI_412]|nr:hypothetical protein DL95DRAFT_408546 [Leptodontidium sp. 2 PMI_412]